MSFAQKRLKFVESTGTIRAEKEKFTDKRFTRIAKRSMLRFRRTRYLWNRKKCEKTKGDEPMKKKLLTVALCAVMAAAMSVSTFAASSSEALVKAAKADFPAGYVTTSPATLVPLKIKVKDSTTEFLNIYTNGSYGEGTSVSTWNWTADPTQKFVIYRGGDGITTIRVHDNIMLGLGNSAGNCVLRYLPNLNDLSSVTISAIRNQWVGVTYGWAFDLQSGGSLTATNTQTGKSGGFKVGWQNFTSSNRQVWNVERF